MAKESGTSALRAQGEAILVFLSIAILSVLGIVILEQFKVSLPTVENLTVSPQNTTIELFVAAIAIFGTFATVTALIIAVKAIIGIVRGLK